MSGPGQVVGPAVVGADDRLHRAGGVNQGGGAVAAGVPEAAHLAVGAAHQEDRDPADLAHQAGAGAPPAHRPARRSAAAGGRPAPARSRDAGPTGIRSWRSRRPACRAASPRLDACAQAAGERPPARGDRVACIDISYTRYLLRMQDRSPAPRDPRLRGSLGYALVRAFRAVNRASNRTLRPHGLSAEQAHILLVLWLEGAMRMTRAPARRHAVERHPHRRHRPDGARRHGPPGRRRRRRPRLARRAGRPPKAPPAAPSRARSRPSRTTASPPSARPSGASSAACSRR